MSRELVTRPAADPLPSYRGVDAWTCVCGGVVIQAVPAPRAVCTHCGAVWERSESEPVWTHAVPAAGRMYSQQRLEMIERTVLAGLGEPDAAVHALRRILGMMRGTLPAV